MSLPPLYHLRTPLHRLDTPLYHISALSQRLPNMHESARQLRLGLASKHLDLVNEHIPQLLLMLYQEIRKPLHIRRPQNRFRLRPDALESVAGPFVQCPVVRLQRPLDDLLCLDIRDANGHEVLQVIQPRLGTPGRFVHGFPDDPANIRELTQLGHFVGWDRWDAFPGRVPGRFAVQRDENAFVGVDGEGVGCSCCAIRIVADLIPLPVDVGNPRFIGLVGYADQSVLAAFEFGRVLLTELGFPIRSCF